MSPPSVLGRVADDQATRPASPRAASRRAPPRAGRAGVSPRRAPGSPLGRSCRRSRSIPRVSSDVRPPESASSWRKSLRHAPARRSRRSRPREPSGAAGGEHRRGQAAPGSRSDSHSEARAGSPGARSARQPRSAKGRAGEQVADAADEPLLLLEQAAHAVPGRVGVQQEPASSMAGARLAEDGLVGERAAGTRVDRPGARFGAGRSRGSRRGRPRGYRRRAPGYLDRARSASGRRPRGRTSRV